MNPNPRHGAAPRPPLARDLKVFISSTSEDLADYRRVARDVVLDMQWRPDMMEHFGAGTVPTVRHCVARVSNCNLLILIVAFRRGWVPRKEEDGTGFHSITAIELAMARKRGIEVIAFLASDRSWPGVYWEGTDEGRYWVQHFRERLNLPSVFFDCEQPGSDYPIFRAKVRQALVSHKQVLLSRTTVGPRPTSIDDFARARDVVVGGEGIFFFGTGVHGNGPLSAPALAAALRGSDSRLDPSIAAAAEYCERVRGNREGFLTRLRAVLTEQTQIAKPLPAYDLVARTMFSAVHNPAIRKPMLIVSASWDMLLEWYLSALNPVIVAHVVRSYEGAHDGKILVLRSGVKPEILPADRIDLSAERCVVYKPMGSPFLNDALDPDLEIDTVVATESDHLTFLGRLQNEHTRIPTAFSRQLQKRSLFFVGYPLDVWHYRLVAQVFQSIGRLGTHMSAFSICKLHGPMEELAWRQLRAAIVDMDANTFATRILQGWSEVAT